MSHPAPATPSPGTGPRIVAEPLDRGLTAPRAIAEPTAAGALAPVPGSERVCAIVVTRNRRELLRRCLAAIEAQQRPVDELLVVDNASEDGSAELVRTEFPGAEMLSLTENLGGAGGFARGVAWARARGHDWLWLMDDDTLAEPEALRALLAGAARAPSPPSVLASSVRWKDGRPHPMNVGRPRWRDRAGMVAAAGRGLLLMRYATFVSVLIRGEAVDRFGLPPERYFIRGDDVEYTARLLREAPGYLVPESRVHHWTEAAHGPDSGDGERFYYLVRNSVWLLRGGSLTGPDRWDYARWFLTALVRHTRHNATRPGTWTVVARGLRDGLGGPAR